MFASSYQHYADTHGIVRISPSDFDRALESFGPLESDKNVVLDPNLQDTDSLCDILHLYVRVNMYTMYRVDYAPGWTTVEGFVSLCKEATVRA